MLATTSAMYSGTWVEARPGAACGSVACCSAYAATSGGGLTPSNVRPIAPPAGVRLPSGGTDVGILTRG